MQHLEILHIHQHTPILTLGHDGLAIGDRKWAGMPSTGDE